MPNGKPGDHPYTDIVVHGLRVYSATADALVREIATLADEDTRRQLAARLFQRYNEHERPDVRALERELTQLRDRLRREAAEGGRETGR
jgi:hypothetical protein